MVSSFTTNIKLEKPASGDYSSSWANMANNDYDLVDQAVAGLVSVDITGAANITLTSLNGTSDQARNATIVVKGTPTGQLSVLIPNTLTKNYAVRSKVLNSNYVVINNAAQVGAGVTCATGEQFYFNTDGVRCRKLGVVPKGTVMMWTGTLANIPAGWAAFSTANGKVISAQTSVGDYAGTAASVSMGSAGAHDHGGTVGATTLTLAQIPSHAHQTRTSNYFFSSNPPDTNAGMYDGVGTLNSTTSVGGDGSHTHSVSSNGLHTHSLDVVAGSPATYGLIFIRKVT